MSDFNNDGFPDLAIGIPGESPGDDPQSGAVAILNGSLFGLVGIQTIDQETFDLGTNEDEDLFGQALAIGDFNNDNFDDLAVGAPEESPGDDPESGEIYIFDGSDDGLVGGSVINQETFDLGTNDEGDLFGGNLAVGDFNNDDFDDLAVGAPEESPGDNPESGEVYIFQGSDDGLVGDQSINQETFDLGTNEDEDLFGAALAVGDFNDDDFDDLAIGVPEESPGDDPESGEITILNGSADGLVGEQTITQETFDLGTNDDGDLFGATLAVGDFNSDGIDDLAVGAPEESPGDDPESGEIYIFSGSTDGLVGEQTINQETFDLGTNDDGDLFGAALTVGDFNKDGFDDLAVGIPGEEPGDDPESGSVAIFNGSADGLVAGIVVDQETLGLGTNDNEDFFGAALAAEDFDRDGFDDLAIGIPGEEPGDDPESGAVAILNGSADGLVVEEDIITQESFDLGTNDDEDLFGISLASGTDDEVAEIPAENEIELFRFRNTTFDTGTYVFVGEEERDFILDDPDLNQTFALDGVQDDGTINPAFTASTTPGDGLVPFFRLESLTVPGTFLFVSSTEYDFIFDNPIQSEQWKKQGFADEEETIDVPEFYLLDGIADTGSDFNRFQNTQNGTFLYAGPAESALIREDANLSELFDDQGIAFESLV